MAKSLRLIPRLTYRWVSPHLKIFTATNQPKLWALALISGAGGAIAAIIFRTLIGVFQSVWAGTNSEIYLETIASLPWWVIIFAPTFGGALVGAIYFFAGPKQRPGGVADVMEARTLAGSNLSIRQGIIGASISAITLGFGGSAGREGPVVYLTATLSKALFRLFDLHPSARRTMLACGVAAAISASFNAPIAGVLFAHEVILGHFATSAFVPIVIASVIASIISRAYFGEDPTFLIPDYHITSYLEVPAFALLGITCAIVAIGFQTALISTDLAARLIPMRRWLRPILGGFLVGIIALAYPQVLGVGYDATDKALSTELGLVTMLVLIIAKTAATAITLGSRMGGGLFSPSLYLGAMTGSAFGLIAILVFPDLASSQGLYAILGMGAVAAAVMGAPISTAVMIFELTGGFAFSIALLFTVSIATGLSNAVMGRSFFFWQLYTRGIMIEEGPHTHFIKTIRVSDFMIDATQDTLATPYDIDTPDPWLKSTDTLEATLRAFDVSGITRIAVVDPEDSSRQIGWATHVKALASYNKVLVEQSREEHL